MTPEGLTRPARTSHSLIRTPSPKSPLSQSTGFFEDPITDADETDPQPLASGSGTSSASTSLSSSPVKPEKQQKIAQVDSDHPTFEPPSLSLSLPSSPRTSETSLPSLLPAPTKSTTHTQTHINSHAFPHRPKPHFPHSRPLRPLSLSSSSYPTHSIPHAGQTKKSGAGGGAGGNRQKLIIPAGSWKGCFELNLTQAEFSRVE